MVSSKKILMLIGLFYPAVGGAEQQCQNLSRKLLSLGHRVTVLSTYREGLPSCEIVDGIPVYRKIRGWHLFEITYMLSTFLLLWRLRRDFEHIMCFGLYLHTVPAVLFALCTGKKIYLRVEGSGASGDFCRARLLQSGRFIIYCAKWAHHFIAISTEIERELWSLGFPEKKIIRIPNSVDIGRFTPDMAENPPQQPVISYIGRLSREKGVDVLLQALKLLVDQGLAVKACFVGDGPMKKELVETSRLLSLSGLITFAGEQSDTAPFYRRTGILVLPSRHEGLPLVLLEGMASGLGIIAASVGGIPEAIDSQNIRKSDTNYSICANGILIPPEDPATLAKAIELLFADEPLRKRLGFNARKYVEKTYSVELITQKYIELFETS